MKAVVLGGGTWGTGFARLLSDRGFDVTLACRDAEQARDRRDGTQPALLDAPSTSRGSRRRRSPTRRSTRPILIVVAVPSRAFGSVVAALPGSAPVLSLTKGLDPETGERLSTLVRGRPVAVLSGPNMAEEVAAGLPTATVIASEDAAFAAGCRRRSTRPSSAST